MKVARWGGLFLSTGKTCAAGLTLSLNFFFAAQSGAAITVQDDAGKTVTLPSPATRIATLAPSLTELVYAAGAGAKLVAVSAYSDFPAAAKSLPQVADYSGVALESLLVQKPDLVIAWKSGNRESDLQRIRSFGIPVYAAEVVQMSDVPRALRQIGLLADTAALAESAARVYESRTAALLLAHRGKAKISVFFEIGRLPLMTINAHHAISEGIALCGGVNVFADAPILVFTPSREALIRLQPQVILRPGSKDKDADKADRLAGYDGIKAAAEHRIYNIHADSILRQGPRFIDGVTQICAALDAVRTPTPTR